MARVKISDLDPAVVTDPANVHFAVDQPDITDTNRLTLADMQLFGAAAAVDTVADLASADPLDGQIWITRGTSAVDDGGGRVYRYDLASTDLVDGQLVVNGPSSVGRYHAIGHLPRTGTGDPETNVIAPPGTLFVRTNGTTGTTLYIKESGSGSTGWNPVTTSTPSVVDTTAALASAPQYQGRLWQTRGYTTVGDGGANLYRYDVDSTATVDGGWVLNGPGGVGRYLAVDTSVANVKQFGAVGNGVANDTSAIQAAATAAGNAATVSGERSTLLLPKGSYLVTTGLVVPRNVNVRFEGARLITTTTDTTQPVLTIGSSAGNNSYGQYTGIDVANTSFISHDFPESGDPNFAAVRFVNSDAGTIDVRRAEGCHIGLQLISLGTNNFTAYNVVTIGSIRACKYMVDLRAGDNTGAWVNENKFYGGNFQTTSGLANYGTAYGVRFSRASGGYAGQNHNQFFGPSFQMGGLSSVTQWSAGLAVQQHFRVYSGGREYIATGGGTTGGSQPVHTSGTVSDGGVSWTYLGDYRRGAVLFNDCGGNNLFVACRFEGAIGGFAKLVGAYTGDNSFQFFASSRDWGTAQRDIEDLENDTAPPTPCNNRIIPYGDEPNVTLTSHNWHKRAIGSAGGWVIAGLEFINISTNALTSTGPTGIVMCRRGINVPSSGSQRPCILVDTHDAKRFTVYRNTFDALGRINYAGLDENFDRIDLGTQGTPVLPLPLSGTDGTIISTNDYIGTGSNQQWPVTIVCSEAVKYVAVWCHFCTLSGLTVEYLRDNTTDELPMSLAAKTVKPASTQRRSIGTPTSGFFDEEGEIIGNVSAASGQPPYFIVTVPGALAPAWGSGATVLKGELRSNSGNIYSAEAAGTTGATPPTHSSGSASDGTISWTFVSAQATVTAAPNLP